MLHCQRVAIANVPDVIEIVGVKEGAVEEPFHILVVMGQLAGEDSGTLFFNFHILQVFEYFYIASCRKPRYTITTVTMNQYGYYKNISQCLEFSR